MGCWRKRRKVSVFWLQCTCFCFDFCIYSLKRKFLHLVYYTKNISYTIEKLLKLELFFFIFLSLSASIHLYLFRFFFPTCFDLFRCWPYLCSHTMMQCWSYLFSVHLHYYCLKDRKVTASYFWRDAVTSQTFQSFLQISAKNYTNQLHKKQTRNFPPFSAISFS